MPELPTGTVTFLFTDIEGSTRLLEQLGSEYAAVQKRHDEIVRAAIAAGGGQEVSTEGDSFFAVFREPGGADRAAAQLQRGLAEGRLEGPPLRVRMGLHTGEAVIGGSNYVGLDVNRAARLAAAAHGGQTLLSDTTVGLVGHDIPPGMSLRDLGQHRLRDIAQP